MKTKIIATIGPATLDTDIFRRLVDNGINFIRINTSYGNYAQYDKILKNLDIASPDKNIKVIFDIKKEQVLEYFLENNLKIAAISFTENSSHVLKIKNIIPNAFLISKIESVEGVKSFHEILGVSDGIMIARGDLSIAESIENVPPLQKEFTLASVNSGKFVVAATEMLLSMTDNPKPTNAEASDVANAVFDGVSAVMLSEETAIGKYPVESVVYMRKIIESAEHWLSTRKQ